MKGKSPLFSSKNSRIAYGNISFMPKTGEKSKFAKYIANRPDIDPNGMFDVIAHGSYNIIEISFGNRTFFVDARQAARIIKRKPGFKKSNSIRLFSCNTGSRPDGFAQHLANALGKPVYAPNNLVCSYPNGKYWVESTTYKRRGEFVKFIPGGIKHGK